MTGGIGVELDPQVLRAVRLEGPGGRRSRVLEAAWDPEGSEEGVRALCEGLGRARRVAVAIRLPLLFTKRVRLPPMTAAERRQALRLEPQRYFPVRLEELAIAVREDDLVFAAREAGVSAWVRALEELGPVDLVEPGPVSLARGLAQGGVREAIVGLDDRRGGFGMIQIRGGAVAAVRRLYGDPGANGWPLGSEQAPEPQTIYLSPWAEDRAAELAAELRGAVLEPLPDVGPVPVPFLSAYGAALGIGRELSQALAPDELRGRVVARRRRELAMASVAALAATVFALSAADGWRARSVERVSADLAGLNTRAAPALALQKELAALGRRARAIAEIRAGRPDPLRALLVVSQRLPAGAYLRSLRLAGGEWQIDGYARRAANVTQALGSAPELRDVHVLAATSRAQVGDQANESFSLAFRLVPHP